MKPSASSEATRILPPLASAKSLTWRIISDIVEVRRLGKSRDEALEEIADRCKLSLRLCGKFTTTIRVRAHILEVCRRSQFKYPDLPKQV